MNILQNVEKNCVAAYSCRDPHYWQLNKIHDKQMEAMTFMSDCQWFVCLSVKCDNIDGWYIKAT